MSDLIQLEQKLHKNFRTIDLTCVQDERLSWKAKGLHTYLISRPPGWKLNYQDLINRSDDGRDSIKTGLDELQRHGYLKIVTQRKDAGKFAGTRWIVTQDPETLAISEVQPNTDFPDTDTSDTADPQGSKNKSFSSYRENNNNDDSDAFDLKETMEQGYTNLLADKGQMSYLQDLAKQKGVEIDELLPTVKSRIVSNPDKYTSLFQQKPPKTAASKVLHSFLSRTTKQTQERIKIDI